MAESKRHNRSRAPLFGLLLAGGASRRMGRDKALLEYAGERQLERAWRLLDGVCERVYCSVRADQAGREAYAARPAIVDRGEIEGPVAGLLAAWADHPRAAWLVLPTDMPLVDDALLGALVAARAPDKLATAFVHGDGTLEPLCAIWEPAARPGLVERVAAGRRSLRELLEQGPIGVAIAPEPARLVNVNAPDEYRRARAALGADAADSADESAAARPAGEKRAK